MRQAAFVQSGETTMPSSADVPPAMTRFRMTHNTRTATADRRRREQELRQALHGGELALHYLARRSLSDGTIRGAEAVLRWPHRRRGLVAAADFMPVAGTSGLAGQIGGWMLQEACRMAASWEGNIVVSVDVSASQVEDDALLDQVANALEDSGLPPDRLEIELCESGLTGSLGETLLRLGALRDLGVGVALDEFGTGAASLSLLKRLPLTTVKLGPSMVRDLVFSREDRAILQAIIQAARALNLITVAMGIETEDQRAFVAGLACDEGQGALFGPPFVPDPPPERWLSAPGSGRLACGG
jgi:EAL domain-containing protein (putative c-di-GMP-specific phosphodiesterase class I)